MADFGRFATFPLRFGGEPSEGAKAYRMLRTVEGVGNSPADDLYGDSTLDGAWRAALAEGLGVLGSFPENAVSQAFPSTVTDLIPEYERILGITPPAGAADEDRREAIVAAWVNNNLADFPDLQQQLFAIDARFSLYNPQHSTSHVVGYGKLLDQQALASANPISDFANFSSDNLVSARLNVGEGVAALGEVGIHKQQGEKMLSDSLPAWQDYNVILDEGFTLDRSLLDVTGLSP